MPCPEQTSAPWFSRAGSPLVHPSADGREAEKFAESTVGRAPLALPPVHSSLCPPQAGLEVPDSRDPQLEVPVWLPAWLRVQLVSSHVAIAPEVARCCSRASSGLLQMKAASSRFWAHPPLLLLLALLSQFSKAYIPGVHPPAMLGLWAVAPGEDGPAWLEQGPGI